MIKNKFSRRIFILGGVKLVFLITILVRMFILQIRKNNYFTTLSLRNKTKSISILPKRGNIFDRFKKNLANDIISWQAVFIKAELKESIEKLISRISKFIKLSETDKLKVIKHYKVSAAYSTVLVKSNLSQTEIAKLETFNSLFSSVFIRGIFQRNYKYKNSVAHVLGYVGPLPSSAQNQYTPDWDVGKTGIESSLNSVLKGELGFQNYEINAKGSIVRKLQKSASIPGYNISLTIDIELQNRIYALLNKLSAGCVVVNTQTGEILSMVSTPSFNPNNFVKGISNKLWHSLITNSRAPLTNKAVSGLFPPASTLKPLIALLALQKGIIDKNTKIHCKGHIKIGDRNFHCWYKQGHGWLNVEQSIIHSCDVFYYNLALKLKAKDFQQLGEDIAFNQNILSVIPESKKGTLPLLNNSHPTLGNLAISAIGQGTWLATPLHFANVAATLANNGTMNKLKILREIDYNDKSIFSKLSQTKSKLNFNAEYIRLIQQAMYKAVNFHYGTGFSANSGLSEWPMSGKTGTAQLSTITEEQRLNGLTMSKVRKFKDHAIFMGFMPSFSPKYALSVVVEHAGFAATSAAPIAGKVAKLLYKRDIIYRKQNK